MVQSINTYGRQMILTDEPYIDEKNVIKVLQDALIIHGMNASDMRFLMDYEKGVQPLQREKKVRADINVEVSDNIAAEIVDFKLGYNWGNPITYIQRGDKDLSSSDPKLNDTGISMLNEMLEDEFASAKDQQLARDLEICGVGYQLVDIKRDYDDGAVFDLVTLDPRFAFVVYDSTVVHRPLMGVVIRVTDKGTAYYTCITAERRYEIENGQKIINGQPQNPLWRFGNRSGELNPLGKVPIVEFERSPDRMGVFERSISDMDALNILVSDTVNSFAQETQSLWWGNDFEFPVDENGNKIAPVSGQWVMTFTGENKKPMIKPLTISPSYDGVLNNINYRRQVIKQKCAVPQQGENSGGSTGSAMSMSSGWQNAEIAAAKEAQMVRRGKMMVLDLILRAVQKSPYVDPDSPILTLRKSDVMPSIVRNRTYDLATKSNTFATWVSHGIHPRHALQQVEAFPDTNLVYEDSKEYLDKYLESVFKDGEDTEKRNQSDLSDQAVTSPILDGMTTKDSEDSDDEV